MSGLVKRDHCITLIEQSLTVLLEYFAYRDTLDAVWYRDTYLYRYIAVSICIANHYSGYSLVDMVPLKSQIISHSKSLKNKINKNVLRSHKSDSIVNVLTLFLN